MGLHHPLATDDFSPPVGRSSLARCNSWDVLCHADWAVTIQEFWEKFGDRRRPLNWLRMLAVYDDSRKVTMWRNSLSETTRNFFGRDVNAKVIIRVMKQQLRRPDPRAIHIIVDAMRSLDAFSRRLP